MTFQRDTPKLLLLTLIRNGGGFLFGGRETGGTLLTPATTSR